VGSAGKTGSWRDFRPVWTQFNSPCVHDCPISNRLPQIFEAIRNGKLEEAAKILLETNPFPSITGRICPHFCQSHCNRKAFDKAISIRTVERYLGDFILKHSNMETFFGTPVERQNKIAVIGSGPAGLAGAFYLRKMGYNVTVFEREKKPGGLLVYGIPPQRLDEKVVEDVIAALERMTVHIKTEAAIDKQVEFERVSKGYDAVLLSTGAWKERNLARIRTTNKPADTDWIPQTLLSKNGRINADPETSAVGDNLFAAGDMVSGPSTVAHAIAAGRKAAVSIDLYIKGKKLESQTKPEQPIKIDRMNLHYFESQDRPEPHEALPKDKIRTPGKKESSTITSEEAEREAHRCFSCGYCRACGVCWLFCPDASINRREDMKPEFDYDYCKGCGICSTECPCGVIVMQREEE
jgi:2-oxoacid:acceptor oxidoreductase delta subunit (pyruvate/2-ketoisovalerate family)